MQAIPTPKSLNLNRDHFWLDDPFKDLCFSGSFERNFLEQPTAYDSDWILIIYVFILYIMCLIIFEGKAEVQDQYPLSLNPVQKADDPIQDRIRSIGPIWPIWVKSKIFCASNFYDFRFKWFKCDFVLQSGIFFS